MTTGALVAALLPAARSWVHDLRAEPLRLALAIAAAALTLALAVSGIRLPQEGGILRFAPVLALVAAPVVAALCVTSPWLGLTAWLLTMPVLNTGRIEVHLGAVQLILTTALLLSLFVGWVLQTPARRRDPARLPDGGVLRWTWLVAGVLIVLALASTAISPDLARSAPVVQHGLLEPVFLGALTLAFLPSRIQLAVLAIAMGLPLAGATVLNVYRMLRRVTSSLADFPADRAQLARFTYYNVGIFGDLLVMAIPLLIGGLLLWRALQLPRWWPLLMALGILIEVAGLYLTFTKSAWLGGLVVLAALFVVLARTWRRRATVLAAALLVSGLVFPWPSGILRAVSPPLADQYDAIVTQLQGGADRAASFDPETSQGEVSITERFYATQAALRMALDHPLLGVGPGRFAPNYVASYQPAAATHALDSAHNLLPNIAAEFGLITAVIVGLLLLAALGATWSRAGPRGGLTWILAFGFGLSLLGFIVVSGTFGVDLYRDYRTMNSDVLYAALLVAASFALRLAARREVAPEPDQTRR